MRPPFRILSPKSWISWFRPTLLLRQQHTTTTCWTLLLAIVALLEFAACFSTWLEGWTEGRKQTHVPSLFSKQQQQQGHYSEQANGTEFCPAILTLEEEMEKSWYSSSLYSLFSPSCGTLFLVFGRPKGWWKLLLLRFLLILQHYHAPISVVFSLLCIVESIRRALEARQTALDTAALDDFEATLASLYSATRLTVFRQNSTSTTATATANNKKTNGSRQEQDDFALTRKFVRVWTPVVSTLVGWFVILPWPFLLYSLVPGTLRDSLADTLQVLSGGNTSIYTYYYFATPPSCGDDPALATLWISRASNWLVETLLHSQETILTWIWKVALPLHLLWMQPWQFIQRLRLFSRWIRYFRYAGPLLRLLLKLQDQFWVFGKTWKQNWAAQSEKAKRLASRSMFFRDIQRLESLTKLQTRLASLPSQYFAFSSLRNKENTGKTDSNNIRTNNSSTSTVPKWLHKLHPFSFLRREGGRMDASACSSSVPTIMTSIISVDEQDDDEDNTLLLEIPSNTSTATSKTPAGLGMTLKPPLGSPPLPSSSSSSTTPTASNRTNKENFFGNNNISTTPERDSVAALIAKKKQESQRLKRHLDHLKRNVSQSSRITGELYDHLVALTQKVTRTVQTAVWNQHLISPQTRFSVVWRLCVTLALLSELGRLVGSWQLSGTFDMRYRDLTKRILGLCQTKSRPFRQFLGKLVRLPHNHAWLDTCRQSSPSSQFTLTVAWWSEFAIDLIGFLDILVWFYTGEVDAATGVIVPKPFFSRCILPGTLTQVLDHPTVPQTIPNLVSYFLKAARAVGYSRVIRWGLALYPALDLLFLSPIYHYLFHPMDKDEYISYTESLVHLSYGLASNSSFLWKQPSTSHGLMPGTHERSMDHHHGTHLHADQDEDNDSGSATEENKEDDFGHFTSFLRPTFNDSYREVLHASISENDGYGLYY